MILSGLLASLITLALYLFYPMRELFVLPFIVSVILFCRVIYFFTQIGNPDFLKSITLNQPRPIIYSLPFLFGTLLMMRINSGNYIFLGLSGTLILLSTVEIKIQKN